MIKYFTNNFPIINLYKKPNKKSEVVTQMIYGDSFSVSKKTKKWFKISIKEDNYTILKNIQGINDIFLGTNKKKYKHTYYLSIANNSCKINKNCELDYEIAEVKWLTLNQAAERIRPYYKSKISILNSVYFFILNMCEVNKKFYQNQMTLN